MNFKSLFFLALVILFSSCGDDPDFSDDFFTGTWLLTSIERTECTDSTFNVELTTLDENDCYELDTNIFCNNTIVFSDDGTLVSSFTTTENTTQNNSLTYTFDNDTGTGTICQNINCSTIQIEDDELTQVVLDGNGCNLIAKYIK